MAGVLVGDELLKIDSPTEKWLEKKAQKLNPRFLAKQIRNRSLHPSLKWNKINKTSASSVLG